MDLQEVGHGDIDWIEVAQNRDRLRWTLQEVRCGGMDWIELAQYRNRWRALVTTLIYLRVP